ncbi:hypothetical protein C8J56DRAFT_913931 [Mycena floridula]|nr:hypothetical protein C8J56DRAFT_913931 [Mycena floridula]
MSDTYELLYFPSWARSDIMRMVLEFTDVKYDYSVVGPENWGAIRNEQKYKHLPRLTVKKADGTSVHLWESLAIELYLGEKHGLLSSDLLERANSIGIVLSLRDLQDKIPGDTVLQDIALRAAKHKNSITETIPNALKLHEAILEKSRGIYYEGDKVTLPDLALLAIYLRFRDIYAERNPINATNFPKIAQLVEALLAGKLSEYERERRDFGFFEWKKDMIKFGLK